MKSAWKRATVLTVLAIVALITVSAGAYAPPPYHDIRPGYGVTGIRWLSQYNPSIKGTPVDTLVYVMEGTKPGPTAVILGGSHANEIAGHTAATLIIERAVVEAGKVFVIPYANNSAAMSRDSIWPDITSYSITTQSGTRTFRYGDRRTSLDHQGPDPVVYVHPQSRAELAGDESRNLNRVHPGRPDGTLTEQLAYGFYQLLVQEKADIAIDMHEAGPSSRLAYMVVANPKNMDEATLAVVELEFKGIKMNIDQSAATSYGLTHREWGDRLPVSAFLIETANPAQERTGARPDPVNDKQNPLSKRVAIQIATIEALFQAHEMVTGNGLTWTGLPSYKDLLEKGLETYLR